MNYPRDIFGSFHDVLNNDFCDVQAQLDAFEEANSARGAASVWRSTFAAN